MRNKIVLTVVLLSILGGLMVWKGSITFVTAEEIEKAQYETVLNYEEYGGEALDSIRLANQFVVFDFYTKWCRPCKYMDAYVLNDPTLAEFLNRTVKFYKVNADQPIGMALRKKYGVTSYPTFVFLNSSTPEEPLGVYDFVSTPEEFLSICQSILTQ